MSPEKRKGAKEHEQDEGQGFDGGEDSTYRAIETENSETTYEGQMIQLLFHLWGDYITQSDWMAQNKTKAHIPAAIHALIYSFPFLLLTQHAPRPALAGCVICVSHFLIDRYRLARYVVWAKNKVGPSENIWWCRYDCHKLQEQLNHRGRCGSCQTIAHLPFAECSATGYSPTAPPWLAFWLLIIADNTLHLTINYVALRWL